MKSMKRKLFSVILVAAMFMSVNAVCYAEVAGYDNSNVIPVSTGTLVADDGTQYVIEGEPVAVAAAENSADKAVTYRYDVPVPKAGGSTTVHDNDGALASTVYLTISYNTRNTPTEYLLTGVSGYWTISDSRVSVKSAYASYGCSGRFPQYTVQSKTNVSVKNHFSLKTGFKDYVVGDTLAVMGASLKVNYIMGSTRTWSFTLNNHLFK